MQPTLIGNRKAADGQTIQGDCIFVNKWVYRFHEPKRGDLVVFKTEGIEKRQSEKFNIPDTQIYVKRLVGLPGERVSIRPPYVYINGKKLVEPKIFEIISGGGNGYEGFLGADFWGSEKSENKEIELGKDEFYVLGDNTRNSLDSRFFGPVKRESIIGKVAWIYWPPERRGIPE